MPAGARESRDLPQALPPQGAAGGSGARRRLVRGAARHADGAGRTGRRRQDDADAAGRGLLRADSGELTVLGIDAAADPQQVQDRISYMPQRFGLYEDLTVAENLDLYADLHGVTPEERARALSALMEMTALGPFTARLAGQAVGRHEAEARAGVHAGPLARAAAAGRADRRRRSAVAARAVGDRAQSGRTIRGLTVLLSTAYLDEAERCGHVIVLHQGKVLAQGTPQDSRTSPRNRPQFRRRAAGGQSGADAAGAAAR